MFVIKIKTYNTLWNVALAVGYQTIAFTEKYNMNETEIIISFDEETGIPFSLANLRVVNSKLADTFYWEEHPEEYEDNCLCFSCRSYGE